MQQSRVLTFVVLAAAFNFAPHRLAAQPGTVAAAQSELQTLADSMVAAQLDTTYMTTLENLDDLSSVTTTRPFDYINDQGGARVISPGTGRFRTSRLDMVNRPPGLEWQGPYATYQPSRIDDALSDYDEGTPLDPWGTPYYFYTPLGLANPKTGQIDLTGYQDEFSQYTIVSYGPDGLMGNGDDLFRTIAGYSITVPAISSVRIASSQTKSTATYEVRVKGYNFGATQGTGTLTIDGNPATAIVEWTDKLVRATISNVPAPSASTVLTPQGQSATSFDGFISEGAVSVQDWQAYEAAPQRAE